ncbi:MAG: site-specific integrase [Caulobacteraceae bacterium]
MGGAQRPSRQQGRRDATQPSDTTGAEARSCHPGRRHDVAGADWQEFDLSTNVWTIPGERHKSRRVHVVPLSATAVDILKNAAKLQADPMKPAGFVFPARAKRDESGKVKVEGHVTEHAVTRAMTRLCESLKLPHGSPHDFRRTGATLMTSERAGVRRFIVSKVLAHAAHEGATVTAVYDRNEYLGEKRKALEIWENLLLEIVGERKRADNVLSLRGGVS